MDRDRQRLLDVIDDPNALENFLGLSSFAAEQQANRAYTQSPAIASPASVIQASSPFSTPYASASPNPAILRSPAPARSPAPIQQFQTVTSPASNVQAGLRHAPSPLQQPMRPGSVPNTPVPSPVSYPPGPGPGTPVSIANFNPSMLQALHNSGAITINSSMLQGMPQLVGGQMQQLMGGSMVQIMSAQAMATPSPPQPQPISHPNTNIRPTPTTSGRSKQPQLLPKPSTQQQSNSNSNSPKTSNTARAATSKVPSPAPQPVQNVPQIHHQHHIQQQQQQHQQQAQPQQQFFQAHHQSPQQNGNSIVFNQGTVLSSQQGGAMVLNSVMGHAGGQQFLIQQPGGGFQILVRPPQQATTHVQAAANANQQRGHTILVPHPLGGLTNAQILRSHPQQQQQQQQHQLQQQHQQLNAQAQQQAMLRLLSPNMGAVQLQQIQTPNGPAYIAVQQHSNPTMNLQTVANLQNMRTLTAPHNASVNSGHLYSTNSNLAPMSDDRTHLVSTTQTYNTVERVQSMPQVSAQVSGQPVPTAQPQQQQQAQPEPVQTPAPPPKKPPPKKRPKKKKKEEKKEVKKLNLEELLKESGITEEEGFDFGLDSVDEGPPPPPSNPPPPQHPPPPQRLPEPAPSADGPTMTSSMPLQLTVGEDGQLVIQGGQGLSAQEANQALLQALQQHGLSLATPSEALEGSIVREPAQAAQPQSQQVQTRPNPPPAAKEQPNIGFQNTFLESLARSQNIPTPKKPKKSYPKKKKKKDEPVAQAPPTHVSAVSEGETGQGNQGNNTQKNGINGMSTYVIAQGEGATHTSSSIPQTNSTMMSVVNINSGQMLPSNIVTPNVMTPAGGNVVHRVQTIQLTPQNQQSLRNIQAQIQYLTSKKDPSLQESTLLQKLIQHQQKILMTGKPIPTIPGQHAQGVQFNSPMNANHSQNDSNPIPQHVNTKGGHSKPVPANIQQNTHLANLLRGDKPATPTRMATANVNQAAQPVRYFHQIGNQVISLTPQQSRPTAMVTSPAQQPTLATPMSAGPQPVRQMVIVTQALAPPTLTPAVVTSVAAKVIVSSSTTAKVMVVPAVSLANSTASTSTSSSSAGPVTMVSKAPQMPVAATGNANTMAVAVKSEPSPVATPVITRGLKRGAITPPKPSISKSTLFEHQLKTDQNGGLTPDCKSPFKNKSNACKRLIRYHVFHEKEPHPREEEKAEEWFGATAEHFALKFRQMLNKYHYLLLMDSMKEAPASEYVMIDRLFVADEKGLLERLKDDAAQPKEEGTVMMPEEVLVKKEVEPRFPKLKLSRKDGEHYKSELKGVRVVMEDVVRNGHFRKEGYECDTASQESSSASQSTAQHYNEWEAIRSEVAFFTQEGEGAGPGTGGPFHLHDDLLHSQVQSAIDGILNLQKLDEGEDHDPSTVTAMDLETSDGRVGPEAMDCEPSLSHYDGSPMDECSDSSELQGDVALNEAVRSILT